MRDVRGISRSVATLPGVHVMRAGPDLGFDRILASEMETPILGISHAVNLVYIKRMIGSTKRCVPGQLQTSVAPLATVTSAQDCQIWLDSSCKSDHSRTIRRISNYVASNHIKYIKHINPISHRYDHDTNPYGVADMADMRAQARA